MYMVKVKTKNGRLITTQYNNLASAKREVRLIKKDKAFRKDTIVLTTPTGRLHKPKNKVVRRNNNPFGLPSNMFKF